MKQQTPVEWLFKELDNILELYPSEWEKVSMAIEQAKAMEKEQIIDSFEAGENNIDNDGCIISKNGAKNYYNETFKNR